MTLVEARELGRYGVTANAIAPRARTRMTETLFGSDGMSAGEEGFDAWDPRNIANVVGFLAAPSSADISGQIFVVFGGSIYAMSAFKPVGQLSARRRGHPSSWSPPRVTSSRASAPGCHPSASCRRLPRSPRRPGDGTATLPSDADGSRPVVSRFS